MEAGADIDVSKETILFTTFVLASVTGASSAMDDVEGMVEAGTDIAIIKEIILFMAFCCMLLKGTSIINDVVDGTGRCTVAVFEGTVEATMTPDIIEAALLFMSVFLAMGISPMVAACVLAATVERWTDFFGGVGG